MKMLANAGRHGKPIISINIHLTQPAFDCRLNQRNRHTPRRRQGSAIGIDLINQFRRNRRTSVHHQMRVRQSLVDCAQNTQLKFAFVRLVLKFIQSVCGANRDCQGIHFGLLDEFNGLIQICYQLLRGQHIRRFSAILGRSNAGS